jgi:hypothetical protein
MLISDKQHEANRANAQKSTGPRTEEGRKRASLNALKHGCTAQTLILPGEDANHFAKFHHNLQTSLSPANALEESLVETLAQNQWATNRIRAHETNLFALGHEQHADSIDTDDLAIQSALAGAKTLKSEMDAIKSVSLYLQRNSRMYDTTLKQLLNLQAIRKAEEKETVLAASHLACIHAEHQAPFDSNHYGLVCSPKEIEFVIRRMNANKNPYIPPAPLTNAA